MKTVVDRVPITVQLVHVTVSLCVYLYNGVYSLCVYKCICACVHACMCVCVCVCVREREKVTIYVLLSFNRTQLKWLTVSWWYSG